MTLPIGLPLLALNTALPFIFFRARSIGGIIPNATIEETHRDTIHITDHPVEQNAPISDHAYKKPVEVVIRAGWSNSSLQAASGIVGSILAGGFTIGGANTYIDQIYQTLLTLQVGRLPIILLTGKRRYVNMLIEDITVRTDEKTENALIAEIRCREIIIVATATTQLPNGQSMDPQNMSQPQNNGPIQNMGAQNLSTNPPSFNASAFAAIGG